MRRIEEISFYLMILFYFCLLLTPIYLAVFWISEGSIAPMAPVMHLIPTGLPILSSVPKINLLIGFFITMIPGTITMIIFYSLARLFRLYQKGIIFAGRNVKMIRRIAIAMLVGQLLNPIVDIMISVNLTFHNPPGFRQAVVVFSAMNLESLITAFLILVIAWVMDEGRKLKENDELTI